jgi:hypothetical protein
MRAEYEVLLFRKGVRWLSRKVLKRLSELRAEVSLFLKERKKKHPLLEH